MPRTFSDFEDFWPYYLRQHMNATNRRLHTVGTTAALLTLGAGLLKRDTRLLALAPLLGYGPAWLGHFAFEKNRPATFRHPLWSLMGDLRMLSMTASGDLDHELHLLRVVDAELVHDE